MVEALIDAVGGFLIGVALTALLVMVQDYYHDQRTIKKFEKIAS